MSGKNKQKKASKNGIFKIAGASLLVLTSGGIYLWNQQKVPETTNQAIYASNSLTYQDVLNDKTKRQQYIDQIVGSKKPDFVISVEVVTEKTLEELAKNGYVPPAGICALTVPMDMNYQGQGISEAPPDQIGKGVKSKILIFENAFSDIYKENPGLNNISPKPQLYLDLEVVLSNIIFKNEFTDATSFNKGIPSYPIGLFKDVKGNTNELLFNAVLDLISYKEEYRGIFKYSRTNSSQFLQFYAEGLKGQALAQDYSRLFNPEIIKGMDPKFIEKLRNEFNPEIIFVKASR